MKQRSSQGALNAFSRSMNRALLLQIEGEDSVTLSKLIKTTVIGKEYTQLQRPSRKEDRYFVIFFGGYTEVMRSYEIVRQSEMYIKHATDFWTASQKRKITRLDHLMYHVEKWLESLYTLQERMLKYVRTLQKHYQGNEAAIRKLCRVEKTTQRFFGSVREIRGRHIHSKGYADIYFHQLEVLELLSTNIGQHTKFTKLFDRLLKEYAWPKVQARYARHMGRMRVALNGLLNTYCYELFPLVFESEGVFRMPKICNSIQGTHNVIDGAIPVHNTGYQDRK